MKLHIHVNKTELGGYTNVNAAQTSIDLANMNNICEQSECTSIILNDILRFMPYDQIPVVLHHITTRLRHKGTLTIVFNNLNGIIKKFNNAEISEKELNTVLFADGARSCCSCEYMERILRAIKLDIKSIDLSPAQITIIAERP